MEINTSQIFKYKEQQVRTINIEGEVWFVAKDVCDILEIVDHHQAVEVLDEDERGTGYNIPTPSGKQTMTVITESGLYKLAFKSRKPEAKTFTRWVTHDVLPTIRKHGAYLTPEKQEELITNPDFLIRLAQELKAARSKAQALQEQAEKDRPKIIFADALDASDQSILVGNLAKILCQNGIDIGQNRLFAWLRENNYLCRCDGERKNMPTQRSIEMGLFSVKTRVINNPDGSTKITRTTKVTSKGQRYFINLFLNKTK